MRTLAVKPELIIDRPELQPELRRRVFQAITVGAWSVYLYLWLPLATLGLWWLAQHVGFAELADRAAPGEIDTAVFFLLTKIAALAAIVMLGWAEYNRKRFGRKHRRGPQARVTPAETTEFMGAPAEVGVDLRRARRATLHIDSGARPVRVSVHVASTANAAPARD